MITFDAERSGPSAKKEIPPRTSDPKGETSLRSTFHTLLAVPYTWRTVTGFSVRLTMPW